MKTLLVQLLMVSFLFNSCNKEQNEMEYPTNLYPELENLQNLLDTKIEKNVENSFRKNLVAFSSANSNPIQSCVYCYFVNASVKYNQLVDFCTENHEQTLLLLLKNMFNPDGLPKPHTELVIRAVFFKTYPDEYKGMLEKHNIDILEEAICRWDLQRYEEESNKEIKLPIGEIISAIMKKSNND